MEILTQFSSKTSETSSQNDFDLQIIHENKALENT